MNGYNAYKYCQDPAGFAENRWAEEEEVRKSLLHIRLLDDRPAAAGGIPVISNGDDVWVDPSDAHSLIIGSTGSKKTRLFVMPCLHILRKARESVVVTDPKGELYDMSSGDFHSAGYDVKVLNLRDPSRSDCWNPLKLARDYYRAGLKDKAAEVVSDLACSIIPEDINSRQDPFWLNTSRAMLRGLCMMMVENEHFFPDQFVNLSMLQSLSEGMNENSEVGPVYKFLEKNYPENSIARMNLKSVVRGSEKTFDNVCVSYDAAVSPLYIQQSLIEMLSCNTVDFRRLGKKPSILYLITPDEKKTVNMIVSVCVAQIYHLLIDAAQACPTRKLPVRVNFLLDEFSNFPEIPDFDAMISAGRSRNMRFFLIIQGLEQLRSRYGSEIAQTIKANCRNWFFLSSRELALLQEISSLCGLNRNGFPLISPVQLQRLRKDRGECLALLDRNYPFMAHLPDISEYAPSQEHAKPCSYPVRNSELFRFRSFRDVLNMDHTTSYSTPSWEDLLNL